MEAEDLFQVATLKSYSSTEESQGKNLKQNLEAQAETETVELLYLLVWSCLLFIHVSTICSGLQNP